MRAAKDSTSDSGVSMAMTKTNPRRGCSAVAPWFVFSQPALPIHDKACVARRLFTSSSSSFFRFKNGSHLYIETPTSLDTRLPSRFSPSFLFLFVWMSWWVGSVQKDHTILLLRIFSLGLFLSVSLAKNKVQDEISLESCCVHS